MARSGSPASSQLVDASRTNRRPASGARFSLWSVGLAWIHLTAPIKPAWRRQGRGPGLPRRIASPGTLGRRRPRVHLCECTGGPLMTRVNFDPHQTARVFTPTNRLTALFASVEAARQAITALEASGFAD